MDDLATFITSLVEFHTPTLGVVFAAILVCLLLYVSFMILRNGSTLTRQQELTRMPIAVV